MSFAKRYYQSYWRHRIKTDALYTSPPTRLGLALTHLPPNPNLKLLDLGTGEGTLGKLVKTRLPQATIHGVEVSPTASKLSRPHYHRSIVADISQNSLDAKLANGHYDAIFALEVLEHLVEPTIPIQVALRKLKPGGRLILSVPNTAYWTTRISLLLGKFDSGNSVYSSSDHLHHFTLDSLIKIVESYGYLLLKHDAVYSLPWYLGRLPQWFQALISRRLIRLFGYQLLLVFQKPFKKPVVGHYVHTFLNQSEPWIYHQITSQSKFLPVVYAKATSFLDQFSLTHIFQLPHLRDQINSSSPLRRFLSLIDRYQDNSVFFTKWLYHQGKLQRLRLLHAHYGSNAYQILPTVNKLAIPLVVSFYGSDAYLLPQNPIWWRRYQKLFQGASAIIVRGPSMKRHLQKLGCPARKLHLIDYGVDLKAIPFSPPSLPSANQPIKLLIASRLEPIKGIDTALHALKLLSLSKTNYHLTIYGTGTQENQLKDIANTLKLKNVTFDSFIPQSELVSKVKNFHLFLHPSQTVKRAVEGNPTSLTERLAAGIPCIATDHGDISLLVRHRQTGWLVPEADPKSLSLAVDHLAAHPELWPKLAQNARRHVETNFNLVTQTRKREALYQSLLK